MSEPAHDVRVLRGATHPWRADVPGAVYQQVGLERVSMTWFRLEPHASFDQHAHEAEQITYVLEGRLELEVEGEVISVGPGDAIAVPSRVPHAVRAGDAPVFALDAWSPPPDHLG